MIHGNMPLLPIALWHRLWFLNNEISKHIYVYMLLPKLSYCRQTSNSGPAETLMLFHSIRGWDPPRGKARGQPQRHQGGHGTGLTEEQLPGLPHGQRPQSQPRSQAAPGSGSKKGSLSFFSPATRPSLAPSGTSPNKQAAASYPAPDVFLALSPSLTTPATTTMSPQSRNSWGQGPCFASTSFRNLRASTCCLPGLCQAR